MKSDRCEVRKRIDYRSAPLEILEDARLSAESKVFVTWGLMHSNGWELRIAYALSKLKISRSCWTRKVRKELIRCGYFVQERQRRRSDEDDRKTNREVFQWRSFLIDDPCTHFAHMQDEALHFESMQDEAITSTQQNKTKSSQKKREEPAAPPPACCSRLDAIFEKLFAKSARTKTHDAARAANDINEARALIVKHQIDEAIAAAALSNCGWPSDTPAAVLAAAENQLRRLADKRHEAAKKAAVARVEEQIRQLNKPADPVATLPGLVRGRRPLQSPASTEGR